MTNEQIVKAAEEAVKLINAVASLAQAEAAKRRRFIERARLRAKGGDPFAVGALDASEARYIHNPTCTTTL
jgi:hypothetical protein